MRYFEVDLVGKARQEAKLELMAAIAKQYLIERGITQPKVRIGALYTPPMTWQRPFTEEETKLQEALLAWKQTS